MTRENIIVKDLIKEFGVDKVSALFSGEPLTSTDAWRLLEIAHRYKYRVEYEDEEGDPPECYVLVASINDRYILVLARNHDESLAYLYDKDAITLQEAIRYAQKIFNECRNTDIASS
ncbi:MAG: hypothetical protein GXO43_00775 [Crenarchaeota archaeon]|nr:hypothetical protein [Thermoproteota archaeon]